MQSSPPRVITLPSRADLKGVGLYAFETPFMPFMQIQGQEGVDSYCSYKYKEAKKYELVSFQCKFLKSPFDKEIEFLYIKDSKSLDYVRLACSVFETKTFVFLDSLGFFTNEHNFKNLYSSLAKEIPLYMRGHSLVYKLYTDAVNELILPKITA